jgi:hypothetical protein
MYKENIHFGLTFPADYPLDGKTCHRLAKLLVSNPNTYPKEAIRILLNVHMWHSVDQLTNNLSVGLKKASRFDDNEEETNYRERLFNKLLAWIKLFSCPLPDELNEIAQICNGINESILFYQVAKIVCHESMHHQKIIDYLTKYATSTRLTPDMLNAILDSFGEKIKAMKSYDSFQDNFQLKLSLPPF